MLGYGKATGGSCRRSSTSRSRSSAPPLDHQARQAAHDRGGLSRTASTRATSRRSRPTRRWPRRWAAISRASASAASVRDDGARHVHDHVAREEAERAPHRRDRRGRQRRGAARAVLHQGRHLRVRLAAARSTTSSSSRPRSWTARSGRRRSIRSRRSSPIRRWWRRSSSKGFIWGVSSRVEVPGAGLIQGYPYAAPCEDMKLK